MSIEKTYLLLFIKVYDIKWPISFDIHHSGFDNFIHYEMIPTINLITSCHHIKLLYYLIFPILYIISS